MSIVQIFGLAKQAYSIKKERDQKKSENNYENEFFYLLFKKLENKNVYIDSNIFMAEPNEGIERFFYDFRIYDNVQIIMPSEQYEEIYNKKNKGNSKEARDAFNRIEQLVDLKKINILNLKDDINTKAYADPIFIKMIIDDLKKGKEVCFFTEDKDLKIRLKLNIESEKLPEENLEILSFKTLYYEKYNLVDKERKRLEDSRIEKEKYDKILDNLENPPLKERILLKIVSFMTKEDMK